MISTASGLEVPPYTLIKPILCQVTTQIPSANFCRVVTHLPNYPESPSWLLSPPPITSDLLWNPSPPLPHPMPLTSIGVRRSFPAPKYSSDCTLFIQQCPFASYKASSRKTILTLLLFLGPIRCYTCRPACCRFFGASSVMTFGSILNEKTQPPILAPFSATASLRTGTAHHPCSQFQSSGSKCNRDSCTRFPPTRSAPVIPALDFRVEHC